MRESSDNCAESQFAQWPSTGYRGAYDREEMAAPLVYGRRICVDHAQAPARSVNGGGVKNGNK